MSVAIRDSTPGEASAICDRAREMISHLRATGMDPSQAIEVMVTTLRLMHLVAPPEFRAALEELLRDTLVQMYRAEPKK